MRLLIVTPRYLPDTGGVERHVYENGRRLAAAGVEVTVLAADRTRQRPQWEILDGIDVHRVPAWPSGRDYYVAPGVYSVVAEGDWDIVHVQSWHTPVAPLAMLAACRRGIPFVVTPHGRGYASPARAPFRPIQRRSLAPLLRRACRIIALAHFERALLLRELKLPPDLISVIPNGSNLVSAGSERPPMAGPTIASVGRLERFKGHHRIIDALPEVLAVKPDARLVVVGEGPYESALRALARRRGIEENVTIRYFPMAQQQALATFLSRVALVVLMSEYETQPIAALEAAALGRPVLVADVAGMREFAESGYGRSVPLKSTSTELARAMLDQLEAPFQPPSINLPSWDDCATELLEIYRVHARASGERAA